MSPRLRPSPIRAILDRQRAADLIRLAGGLPAPELFPLPGLAAAAMTAAAAPATWQYAASAGHPDLRAHVAARLAARGCAYAPEQVLITNGSQHGLLLTALALLEPGSRVAVEDPGYPGAYQALAVTGATIIGVDPDPAALARLPGLALVHRMPSGQNPTGASLDAAARRELAAVCGRAGLTVVEDDAYGDLWYGEPPPPPLAALHSRTIMSGSFSKILAPGLRLGWLAAPADLVAPLTLALQASALHANGLAQATAAAWLAANDLDTHLDRIRSAYRERRDALLGALGRHWPGPQPAVPDCGMFLWLPLPPGIGAGAMAAAAQARGVAVVPEAGFHPGSGADRHLRLCFATEPPDRLAAAARILGGLAQADAAEASSALGTRIGSSSW